MEPGGLWSCEHAPPKRPESWRASFPTLYLMVQMINEQLHASNKTILAANKGQGRG